MRTQRPLEYQTMGLARVGSNLRKAIALFALLAVITGIFSLMGLREALGERERCRNNLHNLALAVRGYSSSNEAFPPATLSNGPLPPEQRISWVPLILVYADWCQDWQYLFDTDRPWDASENRLPCVIQSHIFQPVPQPDEILRPTTPPELPRHLTCPANHSKVRPGMPDPMHYVGIAGLGTDAPFLPKGHARAGVFGYDRRTWMADIKDGASETMMLAETTFANGPWTAGGSATVRGVDPRRQPYLGRGQQFGGAHRGGAMVAFADGSVCFVRESIEPSIFEALATVAGREVLPDGWDR